MMEALSGLALGLLDFADNHGLEGGAIALDDSPTNPRKVTEGPPTSATDAFYDDLVVFIDVRKGAVTREKSRDLSSIADQLDAHSLPN
jgi:hypothetical protein